MSIKLTPVYQVTIEFYKLDIGHSQIRLVSNQLVTNEMSIVVERIL